MAGRRSFKTDVSFLEKISMGASGTQRVFSDLQKQGHRPLELERGSMSFKLWKKIKIKRIRVPDILCMSCGRRIESRAKTSLEISMSHSLSDPERGWDYGLNNKDHVAFVTCSKMGERPIDWKAHELVQYISVRDLRRAQSGNLVILMKPKGAEEGFEARINWPAISSKSAGLIESITNNRLQYRRKSDNRIISLGLSKKGLTLRPLVNLGDYIAENQVVAAVVPVISKFPCAGDVDVHYYTSWLSSASLSDRYAAAKAMSAFGSRDAVDSLLRKLQETSEHIYVRLEAATSLAQLGEDQGWSFIKQCIKDDFLQNRLEATIALGEIKSDMSCQVLCQVLADNEQHPEIRAGAAWSLGELNNIMASNALIESFSFESEAIRIEAARSLAKLASNFTPEIISQFTKTVPERRPGIAWALSKAGKFKLEALLKGLINDDARHWVSYMLGTQDQRNYISEIEKLKDRDPEVYFAVTVLWKIMTSWVYDLEAYG